MKVHIVKLSHFGGLPLPAYETEGSAGMDLRCALETAETLDPGERLAVPSGLKIALPRGFEAQVRPRSGLALKHGIGLLNSPGTIDADYRGEIKILMVNWSRQPFRIERGMRIAQLIVAPITQIHWEPVLQLGETPRNDGGFGHTGLD